MDDADGVGGIMQANAEAPKYHGSAKHGHAFMFVWVMFPL